MEYERPQEKMKALYEAYKKGLEEGRFTSMRHACRLISKMPAPSFFISAKEAAQYIGRIEQGFSLIDLSSSKRRLMLQLYKDYKAYLAEHPGCSLPREIIMEELVDRPAPEFYMKPEAVRGVLRTAIRNVRKEMGWE